MGRKLGGIHPRKGGYNIAALAIGESRTYRPDDHGKKDVAELARCISTSVTKRKDMRFTTMRLEDAVWVRRVE